MISSTKSTVFIVGGLLFGDEGKGTTVEYLTQKYKSKLIVRYNGGPQAMHHIVLADGSWHCFAQFGSGSLIPGVHTLLSKYMLVYPHTLVKEHEHLQEIQKKLGLESPFDEFLKRLHVDLDCIIITPMHQLYNRVLETLRGTERYGTTGMGVGKAADEAFRTYPDAYPHGDLFYERDKDKCVAVTCLKVRELLEKTVLFSKLQKIVSEKMKEVNCLINNYKQGKLDIFDPGYLQKEAKVVPENLEIANELLINFVNEHTLDSMFKFYQAFAKQFAETFVDGLDVLREEMNKGKYVVFEGAQGALLDRIHGIYPHLTRTLCTDDNAMALLKEVKTDYEIVKIGVLRAFSSRHGNGPLITHDFLWTQHLKENHNQTSRWQGDFRVGPFDLVLARYGIEIFKPHCLSVTCLDKIYIAARNSKEISQLPIAYKFQLENPNSEERLLNILKNPELLKITQNDQFIFIDKVLLRKREQAYRNLDLLRAIEFAKPVLIDMEKVIRDHSIDDTFASKVESRSLSTLKIIEDMAKQTSTYVAMLQKLLTVPIAILSYGPTVSDKVSLMEF